MQEFEAAVLDGYLKRETERAERAAIRRLQEAEAAWYKLLQTMWTRLQLQRKYSNGPEQQQTEDMAEHPARNHGKRPQKAKVIIDSLHDQKAEETAKPATLQQHLNGHIEGRVLTEVQLQQHIQLSPTQKPSPQAQISPAEGLSDGGAEFEEF